jgi:16S rRNA (guanine966-N2)-methyltransferase
MRVISGSAKGRALLAPKGLDVRPTTDVVKSAIFSMLDAEAFRRPDLGLEGGRFPFHRVLDIYAGTGALGIEALSRGAEHADFVEVAPRARALIHENLQRTGLAEHARVLGMRAEQAVVTLRTPYDLILLDPPYADPGILDLILAIGNSALLTNGTIVMVEHQRALETPASAGALQLSRTRHYGGTAVSVYFASQP